MTIFIVVKYNTLILILLQFINHINKFLEYLRSFENTLF